MDMSSVHASRKRIPLGITNFFYRMEELKMDILKRFIRDERGLETVEYAIILGIIVVATIGFIVSIGGWVRTRFQTLNTSLSANP